MTGNVPRPGDLDDHHIVPASWGAKKLKGDLGNSILNRTPLTADTNRNIIGDKLPNEYLPKLIKTSGETAVRAILESHFISPAAQAILLRDPFTVADFEEFIAERQSTIQEAIEELLIKERLDLAPPLRELDEQTERVELGLRDVIARALEGDSAGLPPHIVQKVAERLQAAARKNPAMDQLHYQTIAGKLEYCDLRELQESITSKVLWPKFEARFGTKESLAVRFGQLAEVRNGIRHSRSVDAVTRKDGEAALLWFKQVLAK
jgi:hypothetical protein